MWIFARHKNIKAAWYQNGLALMKIRDEGLYKKKYGTFENYIVERWDFKQRHCYNLLDAANLTQKIAQFQSKKEPENGQKLAQIVQVLPSNESHLRPLISDLKTDSERVTVWQKVVEASKNDNVKITAEFVKTKVDEFIASGDVIECLEFEVIDTKNIAKTHVGQNSGENDGNIRFVSFRDTTNLTNSRFNQAL